MSNPFEKHQTIIATMKKQVDIATAAETVEREKHMRDYRVNETIIIAVDHGYGNIKTANTVFATGVIPSTTEPVLSKDVLFFDGMYYTIGEGHKEFIPDKIIDEDYYVLTLAGIAKELKLRNLHDADIHLATGLPLKWVKSQKADFQEYLMKNEYVDFIYRGEEYRIRIVGVDVFPQGYSAVAEKIRDFDGVNMLVDIGNGTMNVIYINNRKPMESKCWTEKYGTNQCSIKIRNEVMNETGVMLDAMIIDNFLRFGEVDVSEKYLRAIEEAAKSYVRNIFIKLRDYEYNPDVMRLYVVGGGSKMVKLFGSYDMSRSIFDEDVKATAKGYEYLSYMKMNRQLKVVQ